jgi:hypothetical protein
MELPLELWHYILSYLDKDDLLRCAQCCRDWRFQMCWPLLVRRERTLLRFSSAADASPYNPNSVLWSYSPRRAILDQCISPLHVLQALSAISDAPVTLSSLTLRHVHLSASIVHLLSMALPSLCELTIDDCAFDGTLPATLHEPCWDLGGCSLQTLTFRATTCQWNEWSVLRLVQRALTSTTSPLRRLELVQPSWSRVRRLLCNLGRRRRLEQLSVRVEVGPGGLVPLETMGAPVLDTEVTHLAMCVDGVRHHHGDLDPRAHLVELVSTSWASLRSLDVRNSVALTDDVLASILAWIAAHRIQLESLALGGEAAVSLASTSAVLPQLEALSHLHVENAVGLDEALLYACRGVRTVEVHGACSSSLVAALAAAPLRWSPVRWPSEWLKAL